MVNLRRGDRVMVHNKLKQLALALIFACSANSVGADDTISPSVKVLSDLSFDITNIYATPELKSLASKVVVYTNSDKSKFFIKPYLLPNWKSYKEQLDKLFANSPQPAQIYEIKFPIRLSDKIVQDEILGKLNSYPYPADERKTKTISEGDLGVVPFAFYQIKMNLGEQERLVYSSVSLHELSDVNAKLPATALGANDLIISLKGTIGELSEFYKDRGQSSKITGTLYSAGYTFSKSELTAKLETLVSSDRTARLLRDEKLEVSKTIETTTSKAAGKLSVNLGFLSFGGGGGKSTTTTTEKNSTQRIMSGSFVSDLIRENASALNIHCISSDQTQCNQWIEKIGDFFLKEAQQIRAELNEQADGSYQLGNKELGYATLGKLQADELIKTKNNLSTDTSTDATVKVKDTELKDKREDKITFDDDIDWEFKGDRWIPTKVDLYVVDTARLKESIQLSFTITKLSEKQESYSVNFDYPAAHLADQAERWQPVSQSVKEKIRAGKKFAVVFSNSCSKKPELCLKDKEGYGTNNEGNKNNANDPIGTLLFGQIYQVNYYKNAEGKHVWEVSGIQEDGMTFISPSHEYGEDHIERNEMDLWGRVFKFDESASVFDKDFGLVGRIVFLEE